MTDVETNPQWKVNILGERLTSDWEISVLREDDTHGQESYGWFGNTKVLINQGGNNKAVIPGIVWDSNVGIAQEVCRRLNAGEEISDLNSAAIRVLSPEELTSSINTLLITAGHDIVESGHMSRTDYEVENLKEYGSKNVVLILAAAITKAADEGHHSVATLLRSLRLIDLDERPEMVDILERFSTTEDVELIDTLIGINDSWYQSTAKLVQRVSFLMKLNIKQDWLAIFRNKVIENLEDHF